MVNIHEVSMTNKDLAEIRESQVMGMPHGEYLDNRDYMRDTRRKLESSPKIVLQNKYAGNSNYVPIDEIEASLDNIFGALNWHTSNFQFYQIGGADNKALMGCSIELKIVNRNFESPVWASYVGTASSYVSPKQGETFLPKLKAEAFKNATKQVGNVFGRNLNRNIKDTSYAQQTSAELLQDILDATSLGELENLMKAEGITNQIQQAVLGDYRAKWEELLKKYLKAELKDVKSREDFETVMRVTQSTFPAAKEMFRNDPECIKMLKKVSEKYPRKS